MTSNERKWLLWSVNVAWWAARNRGTGWLSEIIDVYQERYALKQRTVQIMWAMVMSNLAMGAGVSLCLWACIKAMQEAGKSGRYDNERDAANSQDVWARAAELQEEIDPQTGRRRK